VERVDGYVGNFTVTIRKSRATSYRGDCTGCGICWEKCPKKVIDDVFEAGLGYRKAVYTPFPPGSAQISGHRRGKLHLLPERQVQGLQKFCPTNAIDFDQEEEFITVQVGNIILATGFDLFDARRIPNMATAAWPTSSPAWNSSE
jgi:heterodisulfide reductase subunit A2